MLERPVLLLTQDGCASCERLKKMLAGPLRGDFDDDVRVVHRQADPSAFETLVRQFGVRQTPAMILVGNGEFLPDAGSAGIAAVKTFLRRGVRVAVR